MLSLKPKARAGKRQGERLARPAALPILSVAILFLPLLASSSAQPAEGPVFVVSRADGPPIRGPLLELDEKWSVRLGDRGTRKSASRVPGDEIISIRQEGHVLPPVPEGQQIILSNGDRIPGKMQKIAGDRVHFLTTLDPDGAWTLPLSAIKEIWIEAPDGSENPMGKRRRLATGKRGRDLLLLRNGDVIEGILNSMDEKTKDLQIEVGDKPVTVNLDRVAVLVFNTELARSLLPKEVFAKVVLDNGSRISLLSARANSRVLTGKTTFGTEIKIDLSRVLALDIFQGRAVYLSDLQPRSYQYQSYLGDWRWSFAVDENVAGGDLRVGGKLFDKGIGVHSRSRLTYALEGNYQRFEAMVGLDDRLAKEGTARIQVLVDDKLPSPDLAMDLTWHKGPRSIHVNLSNAKEITLVADFGSFGEIQSCVDWADARLIRK